ncbi:hypothetical protein GGR57DRAFT_392587 [Xylariaceae sp. FL1272]|nr:hypothetical protein GGR57DRAFT_392587 [Xylariaceae sp. FL1272]
MPPHSISLRTFTDLAPIDCVNDTASTWTPPLPTAVSVIICSILLNFYLASRFFASHKHTAIEERQDALIRDPTVSNSPEVEDDGRSEADAESNARQDSSDDTVNQDNNPRRRNHRYWLRSQESATPAQAERPNARPEALSNIDTTIREANKFVKENRTVRKAKITPELFEFNK